MLRKIQSTQNSPYIAVGMQNGTTTLEISLAFNIYLSYDPGIPLLNIYPREIKIYAHKKKYMQIFIAALFLMAKTWKQPICPSVGGNR